MFLNQNNSNHNNKKNSINKMIWMILMKFFKNQKISLLLKEEKNLKDPHQQGQKKTKESI